MRYFRRVPPWLVRFLVRTFLMTPVAGGATPIDAVRGPVGIWATRDGNVRYGDADIPRAAVALCILRSLTDPLGGGPGRLHICNIVLGEDDTAPAV